MGLAELGRRLSALSPDVTLPGPVDAGALATDLAALLGAGTTEGTVPVRGPGEALHVDADAGVLLRGLIGAVARSTEPVVAVEVVPVGAEAQVRVLGPHGTLAAAAAPRVGMSQGSTGGDDHSGKRVRRALVAEDNEALRDLERMALATMFDEVLAAADGDEALARLEEVDGAVEVVVLDLRMPNRNGLEVLGVALARWPDLRVVVASGAAPEGVGQAAVLAGARAVLHKPFKLAELRAVVRGVLADAEW